MTVAELKALAKKKKVSLSAQDKKSDIVAALMAAEKSTKKPAAAAVKKTAPAGKRPAGAKSAVKRAPLAEKATAGSANPGAARKPAADRAGMQKVRGAVVPPVHDWKNPPKVEEPLLAQERISESKYYTGSAPQMTVAEHGELAREYGHDRIVLMTRDPFVVHAYWEATPGRLEREKAWFGWGSKLCVRIYDITGIQFDGRNALGYFDQEVFERAGNWYFDLGRPSHSFCADLGLLSPEGRFLTLARSNFVTTPRDGVADVIDEEWMLVDEEFWKLYGYPEGFRGGVSSPELLEMMRRRRMQDITSPGMFPRERAKAKRK